MPHLSLFLFLFNFDFIFHLYKIVILPSLNLVGNGDDLPLSLKSSSIALKDADQAPSAIGCGSQKENNGVRL